MHRVHSLSRRVVVAALATGIPAMSMANCRVLEQSVTGAWALVSRAGAFEQMELSVDNGQRVFNSWLHERPEITAGQWSLKACTLEVRAPSEPALTTSFTVISADGQRLVLREAGEPRVARYRRIAP